MDIMLQRILELVGNRHGSKKELCDYLGIKPNRALSIITYKLVGPEEINPSAKRAYEQYAT